MENTFTKEQIAVFADFIGGNSMSMGYLEDAREELGLPDTVEVAKQIDEIVFECTTCGWYYAGDTMCAVDGEALCEDCYAPYSDEEQDED